MTDLISRQAAIDAVMNTEPFVVDINGEQYVGQKTSDTISALQCLPSAQPEWEELLVICDVCGHAIRVKRH